MSLTPQMIEHLAGNLTLSTLWRITQRRPDGTAGEIIRVCNYDEDIEFPVDSGEIYIALPLTPAEVQRKVGLSPNNAEMPTPLVDPFTTAKLLRGQWREARVEKIVVNFMDLSMGIAERDVGYLGAVTIRNMIAIPELKSLAQLLSQTIGEKTSERCRWKRVYGPGCNAPKAPYTFTGTVTSVADRQHFTISVGDKPSPYFVRGVIKFTSGANEGLEEEVVEHTAGALTLFLPMLDTVAIGDEIEIEKGCDRRWQTCIGFENPDNPSGTNLENINCEPFLPGKDKVYTYPK
jgi:uncharacterized phage protein (TIGR02218 family)